MNSLKLRAVDAFLDMFVRISNACKQKYII